MAAKITTTVPPIKRETNLGSAANAKRKQARLRQLLRILRWQQQEKQSTKENKHHDGLKGTRAPSSFLLGHTARENDVRPNQKGCFLVSGKHTRALATGV